MALPLVELLEPVVDRLKAVDPDAQSGEFARNLLRLRKEAFAGLPGGASGDRAQQASLAVARRVLREIARIPRLVDGVRDQVASPDSPAAMKLSHALCLKYLVDPRDLLPDDLPAGYGFIDDAVLLWAALGTREHYITNDQSKVAVARSAIRLLGLAVPRDVADQIELALREIQRLVQSIPALSEDAVLKMVRQIIAKPTAPPPSPPRATELAPDPPLFTIPDGRVTIGKDGRYIYEADDGNQIPLG